jgi:serine/threonine-protein kinase
MIGQTVGSYKILEKVGEGGMGVVYKGEHQMIGRMAAIKVLLAEYSQQPNIVKRFFNEARAATAIKHPGIVDVFDFGHHTDGSAYIIMEMLEGEPLSQRIQRLGKLPIDHAVGIMSQVASALGAAHAEGIVHRDLKPDNIFLVPDPLVSIGDRVKLLDFGIAKLAKELRGDLDATRAGAILGTPQYMAPEQCMGLQDVDHRADMYALGCLLFHLLCGRPPFTSEEIGKISIEHMTQKPPNPRDIEPEIPEALAKTVLRLLEKAPVARFQSCGQLIAALDGKPPRAATPVPPPMVSTPDAPTLTEGDTPPNETSDTIADPEPSEAELAVKAEVDAEAAAEPAAEDQEPDPFIARYSVPLALLASLLIGGVAFAVCN